MASNCTGEGLDWILGKIISGQGLPSIGIGCQGNWVHYYPWRYLTCAALGQGSLVDWQWQVMVDLHDPRGLSNLNHSMTLSRVKQTDSPNPHPCGTPAGCLGQQLPPASHMLPHPTSPVLPPVPWGRVFTWLGWKPSTGSISCQGSPPILRHSSAAAKSASRGVHHQRARRPPPRDVPSSSSSKHLWLFKAHDSTA